ncbi:Protein of unknown function [Gryllus bimaculatus]|nr:Protein of unknown function [Gryllus bimaculatus]
MPALYSLENNHVPLSYYYKLCTDCFIVFLYHYYFRNRVHTSMQYITAKVIVVVIHYCNDCNFCTFNLKKKIKMPPILSTKDFPIVIFIKYKKCNGFLKNKMRKK